MNCRPAFRAGMLNRVSTCTAMKDFWFPAVGSDSVHRATGRRMRFTGSLAFASIARPPHDMRQRLTFLGEDTRRRARAVFAHRGHASRHVNEEPIFEVWQSL